ncbi:MAG: TIGR02757 family protein [Chitinispirillaceae bacterium]
MKSIDRPADLKRVFDQIFTDYHDPRFLGLDPLICVRRFSSDRDREIIGLLSAALAYGRVEIVIRSIEKILSIMQMKPAEFTTGTSFREKCRLLDGFKHRFNDGVDMAMLLESVKLLLKRYGSLENCFRKSLEKNNGELKGTLACFVTSIRKTGERLCPEKKSFTYLVSSPENGSACKRMVLYLRWMIRQEDGIDLGVWKSVSPSHLMMPVDTHVAKIASLAGLSGRKCADWKMAEEITAVLKTFDPGDPIKYDFSLCRAGMLHFRKGGGHFGY